MNRPLHHENSAFSLLEMLVVVSIMIVLMALVLPPMTSLLDSSRMEQGGKTVYDQFSLARQLASTGNNAVEVRLINIPGISTQGYSGIQLFVSGTSTTPLAAEKIAYLPQSIAISPDKTTLSKLLNFLTVSGTMTVAGSSVSYVSFTLRPSGAVVPVVSGTDRNSLYVTVVPARLSGTGNSTVPPNFATIQLNPDTGAPLIFRK
ncbi:MAG: Verru_Chthon cassette protein D [Chthoniobacteraceae bacterium]